MNCDISQKHMRELFTLG